MRHPVHLRKVDDNGKFISGGVYGWCNIKDITKTVTVATTKKTVDELAKEVINGVWGNNPIRKQKLIAAGYDYSAVQARVNELLK